MKLGAKIGLGITVAAGLGFVVVKGVQKILEDLDDMNFEDLTDPYFDGSDLGEDEDSDDSADDEAANTEENGCEIDSSENFTETTDGVEPDDEAAADETVSKLDEE